MTPTHDISAVLPDFSEVDFVPENLDLPHQETVYLTALLNTGSISFALDAIARSKNWVTTRRKNSEYFDHCERQAIMLGGQKLHGSAHRCMARIVQGDDGAALAAARYILQFWDADKCRWLIKGVVAKQAGENPYADPSEVSGLSDEELDRRISSAIERVKCLTH